MVKGQIEGDSSKTIKLEIGISGYAIFNFIWSSIALTTFIAFATQDLFWTLLLAAGLLTIEVLMLIVEMNNTENTFMDYFEQVEKQRATTKCSMAVAQCKFVVAIP